MSDSFAPKPGTVGWVDLTVPDADKVRDFYAAVAGWRPEPVDMGGYSDYSMMSPEGTPVAGVCWRRGTNEAMPPVWMIYITVQDADASIARCREMGGKVLIEPKEMGGMGRLAVIEDPSGAICGLFELSKKG